MTETTNTAPPIDDDEPLDLAARSAEREARRRLLNEQADDLDRQERSDRRYQQILREEQEAERQRQAEQRRLAQLPHNPAAELSRILAGIEAFAIGQANENPIIDQLQRLEQCRGVFLERCAGVGKDLRAGASLFDATVLPLIRATRELLAALNTIANVANRPMMVSAAGAFTPTQPDPQRWVAIGQRWAILAGWRAHHAEALESIERFCDGLEPGRPRIA